MTTARRCVHHSCALRIHHFDFRRYDFRHEFFEQSLDSASVVNFFCSSRKPWRNQVERRAVARFGCTPYYLKGKWWRMALVNEAQYGDRETAQRNGESDGKERETLSTAGVNSLIFGSRNGVGSTGRSPMARALSILFCFLFLPTHLLMELLFDAECHVVNPLARSRRSDLMEPTGAEEHEPCPDLHFSFCSDWWLTWLSFILF